MTSTEHTKPHVHSKEVHPDEPIVALDDISEHDTFALECPVQRAFDAIIDGFVDDPITLFFARPGHERQYVSALLRALRQQVWYTVYECCTFSAVALVRDTEEEANKAENIGVSESCGADEGFLAQDSCYKASMSLGGLSPHHEACLVQEILPEALPAFTSYRSNSNRMLEEYKGEHERHVLYIQFMATAAAVRHHGLASRLLRHLEATADAHDKDLYVEVTQHDSLSLFAEHGFRLWKEFKLAPGQDMMGASPIMVSVLARPTKFIAEARYNTPEH